MSLSPGPTDLTGGGRRSARDAALRSPALLVLAWSLARLAMAAAYAAEEFRGRSLAWGDLRLYEFWAEQIVATGAMPDGVYWMYPPVAALVLLLVAAPGTSFGATFVLLMLLVDLAVLVLLVRAAQEHRAHPAGAWVWAGLVPLLGLIGWARLDLVPVAAAAGALLLASRHPVVAGALAAVGAATKGWPVVLGLLHLRDRRWLGGAVGAGLGFAAVLTLLLDDTWAFVANLSGRGIQVESVMALPWTLQQALGEAVEGDFVNGTYEVLEPGTATLARLATLVMVLAVATALWLSRHRAPALRWYAAVTALLATSPLLSTQFLLWLVGAVAVAAALPGPDGALARRSVPVVTLLLLLSHLTFPLQWGGLVGGEQVAAWTLLVRNALLLSLTVWLLLRVRGGGAAEQPGRGLAREATDGPGLPGTDGAHQRETDSPSSSAPSR